MSPETKKQKKKGYALVFPPLFRKQQDVFVSTYILIAYMPLNIFLFKTVKERKN